MSKKAKHEVPATASRRGLNRVGPSVALAMSQQSNDEKTVYLVRHAQSEQNIATARLEKGDVGALGDLVRLGFDAPVSAEGRQQLTTAARSLDGFANQHKIEIVAHSPYQRAVTTAMALFSGHHRPLELLPPLHERTIAEYLFPSLLDNRIRQVCEWLNGREERVIALVGHGQFFKRCIGAPGAVQPNVSILETKYSREGGFLGFRCVRTAYAGFPEPGSASEVKPV